MLRLAFSVSALLTLWAGESSAVGGRPVHHRLFNTSGLNPLDASSTVPKVMTTKLSPGGEGYVWPNSPPVAVCPYSRQDSEEDSCPHKSLNFDMVET